MRRPLLVVPVVLVASACGGPGTIAAEELATRAEDALMPRLGGVRPEVRCPEALAAKVGAEARCTVFVGRRGQEYGVTMTVTAVEDGTALFDVEVDDQPTG